jgi:hypothetical protein
MPSDKPSDGVDASFRAAEYPHWARVRVAILESMVMKGIGAVVKKSGSDFTTMERS